MTDAQEPQEQPEAAVVTVGTPEHVSIDVTPQDALNGGHEGDADATGPEDDVWRVDDAEELEPAEDAPQEGATEQEPADPPAEEPADSGDPQNGAQDTA
jgi:hypothetical protein